MAAFISLTLAGTFERGRLTAVWWRIFLERRGRVRAWIWRRRMEAPLCMCRAATMRSSRPAQPTAGCKWTSRSRCVAHSTGIYQRSWDPVDRECASSRRMVECASRSAEQVPQLGVLQIVQELGMYLAILPMHEDVTGIRSRGESVASASPARRLCDDALWLAVRAPHRLSPASGQSRLRANCEIARARWKSAAFRARRRWNRQSGGAFGGVQLRG